MAEEEKENAEGEEGGKKKGGGMKMIIIIVVVLLVLVGGGVGVFLATGSSDSGSSEDGDELEEDEEGLEEVQGDLPGAIYAMDTFIVNLGIKGAFLKATVQIEFFEPAEPPGLENDIPKLRDAVIKILSSKRSQDILTVDGKERLREEIRGALNDSLGGEEIMQVYFTEFIVQ